MSMNSRYLDSGKEEHLYEDADGFWFLKFENSEITRNDFFYKPSSFITSKCDILADYIACAARMRISPSLSSKELVSRNFLFVWKK